MSQLAHLCTAIGVAFLANHIWVGIIQGNPHDRPDTAIAFLLLAIAIRATTTKP